MKNIRYWTLFIFITLVSCNGGDGESSVLTWNRTTDVTDFAMYVGAKKDTTKVKIDSLVRLYLSDVYQTTLFSKMTIEFNNDLVTYVDSVEKYKSISPYTFKEDSLFVILNSGLNKFVAKGNTESLYRTKSLCFYSLSGNGGDSIFAQNDTLTLEKVLAICNRTMDEMKGKADTIIWCNVKYRFKKN
ncbi:MAG: hypothetical protein QM660_01985 [Dysgonomonas sp.]